jgi:mycofactocin system glycosyltransferase
VTGSCLPTGFRVRVRADVERLDGERVLIGGSPLRALRLAPAARAVLRAVGPGGSFEVRDEVSGRLARRLLDGNLADPDLVHQPSPTAVDLTVVVPVRDRSAELDRALGVLAGLRCVVVDDASHDPPSVAAVARRHAALLVSLAVNGGPGGARNAGLERVETPYVAFVDSDVEAGAETLLRLCRHFADPAVALVGPLVRGRAASDARWFQRYDAAASSLDLGDRPASVRPRASVAWLPSACLVGRVAALRCPEVQGFDAGMRVGEDVDLVWRLVDAGWVVRYDPSEIVDHGTRSTVRGWLGRKVVYGSGSASLGDRHGAHVAPAQLSPAMAVAAAAVLLPGRWTVPVASANLAWAARSLRRVLPPVRGSRSLAVRLSVRGMAWAVRQESSLLLREWWPVAVLAAVSSRTARRVLAAGVLVDSAVALATTRSGAGPLAVLIGRRLDDAAYGTGVWLGVLRHRSLTALLPRGPRSPGR